MTYKERYFHQTSREERIIHTMIMTLILLSLVYALILLSLVFSVIERKQNVLAIKDLSSQTTALETTYANKVARIDSTVLASHNFTHVENATFAVRKDPIASFSLLYTR